jgi:hypothetical protein
MCYASRSDDGLEAAKDLIAKESVSDEEKNESRIMVPKRETHFGYRIDLYHPRDRDVKNEGQYIHYERMCGAFVRRSKNKTAHRLFCIACTAY